MDIAVTAESRASEEIGPNQETNAGSGVSSGEDNKFQRAIAAWRNLDLTNLVPTLDNVASDLVNYQKDSLVQRKDLAQKTKDFRKLEDTSKLGEIKALLKAYQTFIDLLTNQSKSVSSAFLQVYSPLSEVPDPYPLLEASVDSLVIAEETVPKLTAENEHLQKTVAKLTTQLDETESRLEQEQRTRRALEDTLESRVKEVEASWSAVLAEKQDNWQAREKSLEERAENQDRLLKEIKASYEVSQRLGHTEEEQDNNTSGGGATAAELEIVTSELDKANLRLAEVESRNEQLRIEVAQAASQSHSAQTATSIDDDPAFLRLRSENSSLLRRLDTARFEKDSEKGRWESSLRSLERELNMLKNDRDALQDKVRKLADYDDVKRELEVLKSIEFAMGDDDDHFESSKASVSADSALPQQNGSVSTAKEETLEQLLLTRNKKLGDELTILRVSHQNLQARLQTLQDELSSTNMDLEKSRNLTATLENDLLRVQQEASNAFPSSAMSVAGTYTSRYPQSSYGTRRGRASPTSSIISGFDPQQGLQNTLESLRAGESAGGGSGILPMITAQRDRFKKRNSELETELSKSYQTVSSLRSEVAFLQKDNLSLYEKTRYVSSYNRGHPASSSSAFASNPNPSTIQISSDTPSGLSLDRYQSAYEQNISPFAAFKGRESARAFKRMSLPERIVFQITRVVLATRTSRNLFAVYCLGLHLLVFGMLYWMGTTNIESHINQLGKSVGAATAGGPIVAGVDNPEDWHQEAFHDGT
ncbi:CASP C terminal-domain-containing protein [Cryomyces antarcticus]